MPIYEFYCKNCHMIFNFFSKKIDTDTCPDCPKCNAENLSRQVSIFAVTGKAKENEEMEDLPFDETQMERAMQMLTQDADKIDEDDPRQAADLMRKLSHMTGIKLGDGMEEALSRMESGEDPDTIEAEMGDVLENEDPFLLKQMKSGGKDLLKRRAPVKDDALYDLHPE